MNDNMSTQELRNQISRWTNAAQSAKAAKCFIDAEAFAWNALNYAELLSEREVFTAEDREMLDVCRDIAFGDM